MEPTTRGDPESPLRWTCKSVRKLAAELQRRGHQISYPLVAELLHQMDYSLQGNRKTKEGTSHPDRNAQFEHIHDRVQHYIRGQQPVISVDTKKKELVGDFNQDFLFGRPGAYTIADYRLRCNGFRTAARFGTPFAAAPAFECWPIMAFQRSQRAL